ncbi:CLUMA_CG010580, isoform A [Clunio marinus]|uniref:CLUMA_CG010580, isoform A n=1 Tax=Clunio marinus TaxID=568069 RepID=A0A1J1IA71_9DIPT|nr:CLUMA_CG010580, isoform A [Clunio marinus]
MKIFIVIACLACVVKATTMAEHKQMLMGIAQECKANEDATDDDMGRLVEKKPPTTKEGKCLFACIMEQMDVIQDGKLSKEGFLEFASVIIDGDAGKMKVAEELANECGAIRDDDRCELAYKAGGCVKMAGMKRNIDFGF